MAEHWDAIYATRESEALGWYEPVPSTLGLVVAHLRPDDAVIDVGGGDSRLVDALLDRGVRDVTVLDLSSAALARARARLGDRARKVRWLRADVTTFRPTRRWDLWHDRAVFHFLVEPEQRAAYRRVAAEALAPSGCLVVAAFSADGPDHCAGLPTVRYTEASLADAFAPEFRTLEAGHLVPPSAEGDQRPYVYAVLLPT
jgi:trans-aconitate methyltransferase